MLNINLGHLQNTKQKQSNGENSIHEKREGIKQKMYSVYGNDTKMRQLRIQISKKLL